MTDESPADPSPADPASPASGGKPAGDGTDLQRPVPAEQWEVVGRRALADLLKERQVELDRAVGEVIATLDHGTPVDQTHLKNLRDAIEALETIAEHDLTDLVPEATAFEQTVDRVPLGRLADALGVETGELNRALKLVENGAAQLEDGSDGESAE